MKNTILTFALSFMSLSTIAQNPIVTHCYTADPAPVVFPGNDSLYVYCDEDMNVNGVHNFYYMERYRVYSTVDMVNWTDHGNAMPRTAYKWAEEGSCWASQCVKSEAKNKYYWYACLKKQGDWRHYISVGKSDKPSGPFTDAKNSYMFETGAGGDIDPTVFIDDDGTAYLYWGNNGLSYATLSSSMVSATRRVAVELTKEAFGGVKKKDTNGNDYIDGVDCYEEGPWLDKRGDNYYLIYAAGGVPEHIAYSMSKSPKGPWVYKGVVMAQDNNTGSFTNHSGIVNYKGKDYFFYHTAWAPGGGGFNRSMAVEELYFNEDGTIKPVKATTTGVAPLCTLNPYIRQQAETINKAEGISVVGNESTGVYVTDIHKEDYIKVRNVDFGEEGANSMTVRVATGMNKSVALAVRIGSKSATPIGRITFSSTGGEEVWNEKIIEFTRKITGVKDVFFTFAGTPTEGISTLFNFDWWKFNTEEETAVREVEMTDCEKGDAFYDLTGRKVSTPCNGIYIKGGKKIKL